MAATATAINTPASAAEVHTAAAVSPEPEDAKPPVEPATKPANALTPPTSEEMNNDEVKQEHEESELSELDLDDFEDDIGEIEPDHYWDGGKIPVFKPTMDQFKSFKKFVEKIDKYGMKSGIVKVVPPKEWRESLPNLDEYVKRIKIKNPIMQEFNGTQGIYTQQNVEKQRSYNLPEWKALTEETQHQPPAKRGERRRNQEKTVRGVTGLRSRTSIGLNASSDEGSKLKRKAGRPKRNVPPNDGANSGDESKENENTRTQVPPTPDSPSVGPAKAEKLQKPKSRAPRSGAGGGGQAKSVSSRRLNNTAEAADYIDEAAFKNFDYGMDGLEEFTPERCVELESHYWKSLGFNQPMYAADMPGSLFDDTTTSWNVAKLENLLDVLGTKVPGVNTAYLYMGMWKATFAWHLEDVDLYSINYIHFGAPKQWYSISQEDARKFEKAMKAVWPGDSKNCDQFLRHKTYLISPDVLQKQYGVKVNKLVHYEGEFVITFPYGYHSGYNVGYNCAESVNFATESWLEYGRIARKCNCEADNVWVNVQEIERKLRGEPTPEYYEETDDDSDLDEEDGNLPSPPASIKGKAQNKKRKRGIKQEEPKKKKKIRIKIRGPSREPCVMCPNDFPWDPLLSTDNGKKAHRSCALFTPETWIVQENGEYIVCGVAGIDRARLDLKCNFCRSKRGACFQCSSKKCTRAFHGTCALAAGVQVDAGMVPTFGEDGTEYFEEGYDFRCKYHRPKMPKIVNVESLENSKRIINFAKDLKPNDVVQAQLVGSEVFAGRVVENRPSELSTIVDVLPEGDRIEVEWKWLSVLDPDDSQRPKPTANAIPMPEGMNKKAVSISNRQDGVPTQDEPFYNSTDFKWRDFFNIDMPPPGYLTSKLQMPLKLKVNLEASDQLYYYLPAASSELKCFFTDKAGSNEVAPRANFVDRVQRKPIYQHQASRPPLLVSRPPSVAQQKQASYNSIGGAANRGEKPYVYKPKETARYRNIMAVDYQALAAQRMFLADSVSQQRTFPQSAPSQPPLQYNYQGGDTAQNPTPLRSFPSDHYYSTKTLPAAYPGEHSVFREAARRESNGALAMERPDLQSGGLVPNYQSVKQQQEQMRRSQPNAPIAPMMSSNTNGSRPSSSSYGHQSHHGAPLSPATTRSTVSVPRSAERPPEDQAYLEDLRKYPYLLQSWCRRPKVYESPYPIGGGFTSTYNPAANSVQEGETESSSVHTPHASISHTELSDGQDGKQQWTPPSQIWDRAGVSDQQTPPPSHQPHAPQSDPRQYPPATYSTPQEAKPQVHSMPSTASRDGAQARMLRDQGFAPYQQHPYQRNSAGQQHDTAGTWNSPNAPTPSPLSDPNTPGVTHGQMPPVAARSWNPLLAITAPSADGAGPGEYGYGPMMPQVPGSRETWRLN